MQFVDLDGSFQNFIQREIMDRAVALNDIAALAMLFTFGALMNAFGMVSPVYAFERWLSSLLQLRNHQIESEVRG